MHATCLEDLQVYQRAVGFAAAVFAATRGFESDRWLRDQLNEGAESVMTNIAEGFRQPTDRAFARYLSIAAGSAEECRAHLLAARMRGHLGQPRCTELTREATEIATMLVAFIRYLHRCDRKDRLLR